MFRLAKRLANISQSVEKISGFQTMGHETTTNDHKDLTTKDYDHLYKKKEETSANEPA